MEDLPNKWNPTRHDDKDVPAEYLTKCSDVEVTSKAGDTDHADVIDQGRIETRNQQEPGLGATQRNLSQEEMMQHMTAMMTAAMTAQMKEQITKEIQEIWEEKWNTVGNENAHEC
jgi:pantothenate kinase type III